MGEELPTTSASSLTCEAFILLKSPTGKWRNVALAPDILPADAQVVIAMACGLLPSDVKIFIRGRPLCGFTHVPWEQLRAPGDVVASGRLQGGMRAASAASQERLEARVVELERDLAAARERIAELTEQLAEARRGNSAGITAPSDFDELVDAGAGCDIGDTADRGITLSQLRRLATFIEHACSRLNWTSTMDQQPLQPLTTTLYDVAHHVIKPATANRACSYVELVAHQEQPPKWFVSHWWGEPVLCFVACLAQHAADRNLRPSTSYWVCAYANNQHRLQDDIVADPSKSSFRRAMASAVGTVSVVDRDATCFKRVWCAYEVWISLDPTTASSTYKYDMYTALNPSCAVGFTDGLAEVDEDNGLLAKWLYAGGAHAHKAHREAMFPADVVRKACEIKLHEAAATEETDRRRILNAIARRGLDLEPLANHKNYVSVNQALKWRIGLAAHAMIESGRVPGVQLDKLEAPASWAGRAAAAYLPLCEAYTALCGYALARQFGERAVQEAERAKDEVLAKACVVAGWAMYQNANYAEALSYLDRALAIREPAVGREHPAVGKILNYQGLCCWKTRKWEEARKLFEESLAIRKASLGENHPEVGWTLNNMGNLLDDMGERERALGLYEEALAIRGALGERHPGVAVTLYNMGILLAEMGQRERALSLYEEALTLWKEVFGEKHPDVADTLNNMGVLLADMGEWERALSLYEEALAIQKEALGGQHLHVGRTLYNMGNLQTCAGRDDEAAECYEAAALVYAQAYGGEHWRTTSMRDQVAEARRRVAGRL